MPPTKQKGCLFCDSSPDEALSSIGGNHPQNFLILQNRALKGCASFPGAPVAIKGRISNDAGQRRVLRHAANLPLVVNLLEQAQFL
jgi:hypothetical protein